jgi:hypothetical protein
MTATPAEHMVHCDVITHPSGAVEAVVLPPGKTVRWCQRCERQFVAGPAAKRCPNCRYMGRAGSSRPAKYRWTAERDELLRERYDSRVKGRAAEIAAGFGWPKWVVTRRAQVLAIAHVKEARWTSDQDAFLLEHAGVRTPKWIAKRIGRTLTAVLVRLKRLHISRRVHDGLTCHDVALCFGIDGHAVAHWIEQGKLTAKRRGTDRENDPYVIQPQAIRQFVRRYPSGFRLDKVDQLWFMDLVFNGQIGDRL